MISETNLRATLGILARVAAPGSWSARRDHDRAKGGLDLGGRLDLTPRPARRPRRAARPAFHAPKPPSMWPTSVKPSVFSVSAASAERIPPAQYTTMRVSNWKNGL